MSSGPRLIFLIGLPGSGKSSLAAQLQQKHPDRSIISTDAIRAQLFGDEAIQGAWGLIWREMQQQFCHSLHQIYAGYSDAAIYDATNARRKQRRATIALIRSIGFRQIMGIWLDTPLEICLKRNLQRDRQVPEAVIYRMHRQLRSAPPGLSDGLDSLRHFSSIRFRED